MYHALLTNRYLTSRVIPLIAVAAVALCVALVIIVVSVMTGFLDMVKNSGRKLMGDVVIQYQTSGIPYYERLINRITQLPEAAAATPVVDGVGVMQMPYPDGPEKHPAPVYFWGIQPQSFAAVTGYEDALHWKSVNEDQWNRLFSDVLSLHWKEILDSMSDEQRVDLLRKMMIEDTPDDLASIPTEAQMRERLPNISQEAWQQFIITQWHNPQLMKGVLTEAQWNAVLAHDARLSDPDLIFEQGMTLQRDGDNRVIVMGMHVSEGNERQRDGSYRAVGNWRWWMPRFQVTLMTIPISRGTLGGADSAESRVLNIVNEFVSGVFLIDKNRVMIPLSIAQSMLHLDQAERMDDPDDPFRVTGIQPAKATMVLVRAAENITPEQLRDAVVGAYEQFMMEVAQDPQATVQPPPYGFGLTILTWAEQQASFIAPVEKEREMMRILFSIIYLVCAGLILAIFWAIVHEKTRDIGILRSIGASRGGILWIFLRYGLIVGVIGAFAGLGLAYAVVRNINAIHEAIGEQSPWWLWMSMFGGAVVVIVTLLARLSSRGMLFAVLWTVALITMLMLVIGLIFHRGTLVWDPSVYYFSEIPNQIDHATAITTMIGAVVFSLLGAFIPAAKAADIEPVQALRYE